MSLTGLKVRKDYVGDGIQTAYIYDFLVDADSEMVPYLDNVKQTSGFVVTGAGNPLGGDVTFTPAPGDQIDIALKRETLDDQQISFAEFGPFFVASVEAALDKLTKLTQEQKEEISRCAKAAVSNDGADLTFPEGEANSAIVWDAAGTALINAVLADLGLTLITPFTEDWLTSIDAATGRSKLSVYAQAETYTQAETITQIENRIQYNDVISKVFGDSPYTVLATDNGVLIEVDTSGGAVTISLPSLAAVAATSPFRVTIKKTTDDVNLVTIANDGSDTTDGAASDLTIGEEDAGYSVVADIGTSNWSSVAIGTAIASETLGPNLIPYGDIAKNPKQEGTSFVAIADNTYVADLVKYRNTSAAVHTVDLSGNTVKLTVTTNDTAVAAGDRNDIEVPIEGFNVADLEWGTANAKPLTITFKSKVDVIGSLVCALAIRNEAEDRSYVHEFTALNTETEHTITIPGDQSGTWDSITGRLRIGIAVMAGSTFQAGSADAWSAGSFLGLSTTDNFNFNNGAIIEFGGFRANKGSSDAGANYPGVGEVLQHCRRHIWRHVSSGAGHRAAYGMKTSTTGSEYEIRCPVEMRIAPNVTVPVGTWTVYEPTVRAVSVMGFGTHSTHNIVISPTSAAGSASGSACALRSGSSSDYIQADSRWTN